MASLKLIAENDTFVSSYYPTGNYSDLNYLLVSMSLEYPYQYTSSLLQFDVSYLEDKLADISSIRLNLFVNSIEFDTVNLDVLLNSTDYDSSIITWNTKPSAPEIIAPISISKECFNTFVEVDITERVKKYILSSNNPVLGLTLLMSNPLGAITFTSSRHFKQPFLRISFNDDDSYIASSNTHNLHIDSTDNTDSSIVNNLAPVIFDKENISGKNLFSFDNISGYFTIYKTGSYLLKWSISIKSAYNISSLSFSILDDTGNTVSSISASPNLPMKVKGTNVLRVTSNRYKFTIINTSGEALRLVSNKSLRTNIELIKI